MPVATCLVLSTLWRGSCSRCRSGLHIWKVGCFATPAVNLKAPAPEQGQTLRRQSSVHVAAQFRGRELGVLARDVAETPEEQDERDAESLYSLMEQEVLPLYYDRDEYGVPHGWLARVKASLASIGPRFCATRMLTEYVERSYGEAVKLG